MACFRSHHGLTTNRSKEITMPAQAPALSDERALLLAYIAQQRDGLRNAAFGRETEEVLASIDDLGRDVPVPKGVPWFPDDVEAQPWTPST
jgi:hypothetical protein